MTDGMIEGQRYEFPHCNPEVLHAPGECYYCDQFPERQARWQAAQMAFTPNEANGWSGNVAVKAGEVHEHLGGRYVVGSSRCHTFAKRGWYCRREPHMEGPCALVPRWWNLRERLRHVGRAW